MYIFTYGIYELLCKFNQFFFSKIFEERGNKLLVLSFTCFEGHLFYKPTSTLLVLVQVERWMCLCIC